MAGEGAGSESQGSINPHSAIFVSQLPWFLFFRGVPLGVHIIGVLNKELVNSDADCVETIGMFGPHTVPTILLPFHILLFILQPCQWLVLLCGYSVMAGGKKLQTWRNRTSRQMKTVWAGMNKRCVCKCRAYSLLYLDFLKLWSERFTLNTGCRMHFLKNKRRVFLLGSWIHSKTNLSLVCGEWPKGLWTGCMISFVVQLWFALLLVNV